MRVALERLTAEWANFVNDFVSTLTGDQRANNEQSTIHTHNTAMQLEGFQSTHNNQADIDNKSTIAWHTSAPGKADKVSQYSTDAEFAARLDRYLLRESFRSTTSKDGIPDNHTGGIIHALTSAGNTGHQSGSEFRAGDSQKTVFNPDMQAPTYDPLQAQPREVQEPRRGSPLSAAFMAQLAQLQLQHENEASIISEQLAKMAETFENMQLLFSEELARMSHKYADQKDELRKALQETTRR